MIESYTNPILRGMYPDPSIVLVEGTYYMVNSTFEYYPGIALSKSQDLLNWEKIPGVITETTQADLRNAKSNEGIFAVCIRHFEDYFYVITTNFAEFKNFIIRGKLTDDGTILWEKERIEIDIMGIDPDLYQENQRTYVQFTGYIDDKGTKAIQQVEINLVTGEILRGPEVISFGTGGRDVEGPHIIKKNDHYYLLAAEGGTGVGHMITMFKSENLWGPFVNQEHVNPLFTNRDRATEALQNIGHADLFQDTSGNWWLTCLGTRPANVEMKQIANLGRETLLYPVIWDQEWPQIYNGVPSEMVDLTAFPLHQQILTQKQILPDFKEDFSQDFLHPEWLTLRNNLNDRLSLKNNLLLLSGSPHTFEAITTPSFLGLRQTEHTETLKIQLSKEETLLNQGKIGIVSMIDSDHYAGIFVEANNDKFKISREQTVADLTVSEILGELTEFPDSLELNNLPDRKIFKINSANKTIQFETSSLHFSNEAIAALNTGDVQGIYVLDDAVAAVTHVSREKI